MPTVNWGSIEMPAGWGDVKFVPVRWDSAIDVPMLVDSGFQAAGPGIWEECFCGRVSPLSLRELLGHFGGDRLNFCGKPDRQLRRELRRARRYFNGHHSRWTDAGIRACKA